MSIGQKIEKVADAVYEKGKTDIISNSKYIEKQATGKVIRLNDVSEIPHKVKIKAGVKGKNWFDNDTSKIKRVYYTRSAGDQGTRFGYELIGLPAGECTFTLTRVVASTGAYISGVVNDKDGNYTQPCALTPSGASNSTPLTININDGDIIYIYDGYPRTDDEISKSIEAFESVQIHLEYNSPEPTEVKIYGKNLFNNDTSLLKEVTYTGSSGGQGTRIGYEPITLPAGDYTFTLNDLGTVADKYIYGVINDKDGNFVGTCNLLQNTLNRTPLFITLNEGDKIYIYDGYLSLSPTASAKRFNDVQIQLEPGPKGTDFEEFKEPQTITATPEGVEIPSDCEGMYLIADNDITVDYWGSYGKITSLRKWWYDYTKNMPSSGAPNAFSYYTWTDETFNPQDDMICRSANSMFANSRIRNIRGILKRNKVKIVFDDSISTNSQFFSVFAGGHVQCLPYLKLPTTSTAYGWFQNCTKLIEVDGYECTENHTFETSSGANKTFQSCTELVKIIFRGTVAKNCDIHWSTKLSRESILSLLKVLNTSVTEVTITLPSMCIDTATDTKAMIEGDTELNTAYTQALANGYSIAFQ